MTRQWSAWDTPGMQSGYGFHRMVRRMSGSGHVYEYRGQGHHRTLGNGYARGGSRAYGWLRHLCGEWRSGSPVGQLAAPGAEEAR